MIKKLLVIFSLTTTLLASAQQNLDFLAWGFGGPTNWTATFGLFAAGSVTQNTTDPGESLSSLQLQTTACAFCPFFGLPAVVPGLVSQNIPFTDRPTSVSVLLRANIDAGDEALFIVQTTLWDAIAQTNEVIGGAGAFIPGGTAMTSWQAQTFPFQYQNAANPDSINIIAMSSDSLAGQPTTQSLNSILEIDAIVLNYPAGISDVAFMSGSFIAYPNPATNEINIVTKNVSAESVNVYDVTGRLIKNVKLANGKVNIDISNLDNGIYVYSILDKNNSKLNTSKFSVAK
jgi:hypothetical protein